ncbi:MAG: HIT family protein [Candidatus Sumerlaeaceae bacterium]|nr:HIT family protein [Candidatus Sumerlaeaceae bacterium]
MPSLFTRIINGELPGRFVWKDDVCVGMLTIAPMNPGHTLIIPREEVDHWVDMKPDLSSHLFGVAQSVSKAIHHAFQLKKVGLIIAGLEVLHTHIHLVPINNIRDMDFDRQDKNAKPEDLDAAADKIRTALRELGYMQVAE